MSAKFIIALCAQAVLLQVALAACTSGGSTVASSTTGYSGYGGFNSGCQGFSASGGGLPITSSSPLAPVGLSVESENKIEGCLSSTGKLPFITAVAVEGQLPTAGEAATTYGCGGNVGIRPAGGYGGYNAGYDGGLGYGAGLPDGACGCGGLY